MCTISWYIWPRYKTRLYLATNVWRLATYFIITILKGLTSERLQHHWRNELPLVLVHKWRYYYVCLYSKCLTIYQANSSLLWSIVFVILFSYSLHKGTGLYFYNDRNFSSRLIPSWNLKTTKKYDRGINCQWISLSISWSQDNDIYVWVEI